MGWRGKAMSTASPKYKSTPRARRALAVGFLIIGVALLLSCPNNDLLTDVQQKVQEAKSGQTVATPTFSPAPAANGTYASSSDFSVTISCATDGAAIHYTTDGSTPTVSTILYTGPISVAGDGTTMTIKAVGTKEGMTDSLMATAKYTINYNQLPPPQFSPPAGTYSSDQSVHISCATSGATIYYTTDNSTPTTSSAVYSESSPISVAGDGITMTIKAIATKNQMINSTAGSAYYWINHWVSVGSADFSEGETAFTSLAIDSSGTPYVTYKDFANSSKATVMKFNGTSWVTVGSAGFSAGAADWGSLAIDSSGTPYIVYRDNANSNKATVMRH